MRLMAPIWPRVAVLAIALGGVFAGNASASSRFDSVGHIYVNDNTSGTNTIAAFDRHANGTLTPVPGSPFATGGAGTGAGIGSQGALQVSDGGRYLLAVDAGSNQVSVLRIKRDGTLRLIRHGVVDSGGIEPVSIAVHRGLVYVANAGNGGSNYTGFVLGFRGHLEPLPGSTFPLPDGAQPGRRPVQLDGDEPRRNTRRHLHDRQLPRSLRWPPGPRSRIAVRRAGAGPIR